MVIGLEAVIGHLATSHAPVPLPVGVLPTGKGSAHVSFGFAADANKANKKLDSIAKEKQTNKQTKNKTKNEITVPRKKSGETGSNNNNHGYLELLPRTGPKRLYVL